MSDKPEKIEWRKLQASNGDSYYGYFKGLQISYIMDFGKKDEYILSFEDVEEEEKTYHSTVDDAKSRAEELLDNWLIRADLANQIPQPSEVYDRIQGYIRVIQEKDALIADLAKPNKSLKDHEIQELVNLLRDKLSPLTKVQSLREMIHNELVPYLESRGLRIDRPTRKENKL